MSADNVPSSSRILVVDDEPRNRTLLETMLRPEGYEILIAENGEAALSIVSRQKIDLILLDIMMPGMTGYQVVGKLKSEEKLRNIPVIIITSLNDRNARLMALNAGAEEFVNKPVDRAELWVRVRNLLRLKEYNDFIDEHRRVLGDEVRASMKEIGDGLVQTITRLNQVIRRSAPETAMHSRRIGLYAECMANHLGKDTVYAQRIYVASQLHDIGKVAIPDSILFKPGPLTKDEFEDVKTHCATGARILQSDTSPLMKMAAEIAISHHERWDGSGYPYGLRGETIPFSGMIVAICDVYDALRTTTPFRKAVDHNRALHIILGGDERTRPHHFDPDVLSAFKDAADNFATIFTANLD